MNEDSLLLPIIGLGFAIIVLIIVGWITAWRSFRRDCPRPPKELQ